MNNQASSLETRMTQQGLFKPVENSGYPGKVEIIKVKPPVNRDGGPGSGNFGHKGVEGQVGGSAPSEFGKGNSSIKSAMSKASSSKEYTDEIESFKSFMNEYDALHEKLKNIPHKKPENEWDESERGLVEILGKNFAPSNPEWHKVYKQAEKAQEEAQKHIKKANDIILAEEPSPHIGDFSEPKKAEGEYKGFKVGDTGTSMSLKGSKVVEMSPLEYLNRCAALFTDIDGKPSNLTMQIRTLDKENVDKYAEMMKNGEKFFTPWLDERGTHGQEGRHRAAAAYQLGIDKIPVVYWSRNERHDSAFFQGELNSHLGERNVLYPGDENKDGGPGSGNFGHAGRKGKVGGSTPDDGGSEFTPRVVTGSDYSWSNKEDYEKAKKDVVSDLEKKTEQLRKEEENDKQKLLDSFGGNFRAQRIEIMSDSSLSNEEKLRKIAELKKSEKEYNSKLSQLSNHYAAEEDKMNSTLNSVYDPEYEYPKRKSGPVDLSKDTEYIREQIKDINPDFNMKDPLHSENCQRCVVAAEYVFRGYNVQANATNEGGFGYTDYEIGQAFIGGEWDDIQCGENSCFALREQMKKWGNGSRAIISTTNIMLSGAIRGHVYNVSYIDDTVTIIDTQSSRVWKSGTGDTPFYSGDLQEAFAGRIMRTDNLDLALHSSQAVKEIK